MSEDNIDRAAPGIAGGSGADWALSAAGRETAETYLKEQTRLASLQADELLREDKLRHWSLRVRHLSDMLKLTFELGIALIIVLLVVLCAAAVWDASQADGIVVDTFSVPPQFAQAGMAGDVIADDLTNKVAAVRDFANAHSIAHSKGVKNERDEEIKVDIPDTGISLAEVSRYLRSWLGHERHLSGNLRNTGDGKIALTVALDGTNATTFVGPPSDLDRLEPQAAELVFQGVDPSNYVLYLYGKQRSADSAAAAIQHLIKVADSPGMLSDGYSLWGNWTRRYVGDLPLTMKRSQIAVDADPRELPPHMEMMFTSQSMGHDEEALRQARQFLRFKQEEQYAWREGRGFGQVLEQGLLEVDFATGDFSHAATDRCGWCGHGNLALGRAEYAARLHDIERSHALIAAGGAMDDADEALVNRSAYFADAAAGDWGRAVLDARSYGVTYGAANPRLQAIEVHTGITPLLAVALAHAGKLRQAHAEIDKTPGDCVLCETARGEIDALENNSGGAAWWFARASRDAPSLPFAEADLGAMLLHKGDYDGAIAKFRKANVKGPHFADPLEMWGEALMLKNRSDLALPKFEEANKYAPNWGRLHLKWGEALFYAGRRGDARKQFAAAAQLDMSAAEMAELTRLSALHE
jgi:tetratricopeptide (TPR) repeat protein